MFPFCFWIHFKSNNYPHSPVPPPHFYASFPVFMAWTTISMSSNSDTDFLLSSFGHVSLKQPQSLHEINVPLYLYLGSQARNLPLRVLPTLLFSTFFQLAMRMEESLWPTSLKPQPPLYYFNISDISIFSWEQFPLKSSFPALSPCGQRMNCFLETQTILNFF